MQRKAQNLDELSFGFSASGWLMIYQLGVAHALQRHKVGSGENHRNRFVGSSGGAATAAALALECDAKLLADFMVRCCADFHKNPVVNIFKMRKYAESCVRRCMDSETFRHSNLKDGRLNVAVTELPSCKSVVINKFHSNEEYVEAVMASCTFTPFAGFPFQLNSKNEDVHGKWVCDGGLAAMIPTFDENTITVTPFHWFDADIKPSRYIPAHWAVMPPSIEKVRELFWLGAKDGMDFMERNGHSHEVMCHRRRMMELRALSSQRIKELLPRAPISSHSTLDELCFTINPHTHGVSRRIRVDSDTSMESFSSTGVRKMIENDADKSGKPLSAASKKAHILGDSVAMVVVAAVRPMALGVVYAELASKAVLSLGGAAVAAIENTRRNNMERSTGWLSLRRWIHEEQIGTAKEALQSAKHYATLASGSIIGVESEHKKQLSEGSLLYRVVDTKLIGLY